MDVSELLDIDPVALERGAILWVVLLCVIVVGGVVAFIRDTRGRKGG